VEGSLTRRISAVVTIGVLAAGCGSPSNDQALSETTATSIEASTTSTVVVSTTTTVAESTSTSAAPATTIAPERRVYSRGLLLVGDDIPPGRYVANPRGGELCTWARYSSEAAGVNDVIYEGASVWQTIVDIAPTDVAFSSNACGDWLLYRDAGELLTTFPDGDWTVGEQVAPGAYAVSPGGTCYWALHTDFSGDPATLIRDGIVQPETVGQVEIAAGQMLRSKACGEWRPAGVDPATSASG
jgi:hypothetical protein